RIRNDRLYKARLCAIQPSDYFKLCRLFGSGRQLTLEQHADEACQLLAMTIAQGFSELLGEACLHAQDAWGKVVGADLCTGDAAGQAQESFFGQHRLVDRLELDGAFETDITLFGEPQQRAEAALMTLAGQAELIRFLVADQVFDVQCGLAREGLVEHQQATRDILVEVLDLQIHRDYWR